MLSTHTTQTTHQATTDRLALSIRYGDIYACFPARALFGVTA